MIFNEQNIKGYNVKSLKEADPKEYLIFIAHSLRYGACHKAKFFMWLDRNNYEIKEQDEETVNALLKEALSVFKKSLTDDNPEIEFFDQILYKVFEKTGLFAEADMIGLSLTLLSFISFKKELISEEEYLEIRDLLVPYKIMISQCKIKPEKLFLTYKEIITDSDLQIKLLCKLGKGIVCDLPSDDLVKEAFKEITYDRESWEKE